MAKRRSTKVIRRSNGGNKLTIPLAVVAGFAPAAYSTINFAGQVGWKGILPHLSRIMTGYNPDDGRFYPRYMLGGLGPVVLGVLIHKFIGGKLGVNRALKSAGIPLIRL